MNRNFGKGTVGKLASVPSYWATQLGRLKDTGKRPSGHYSHVKAQEHVCLVVDSGCWLEPQLQLLTRTPTFGLSMDLLGFLPTWLLDFK